MNKKALLFLLFVFYLIGLLLSCKENDRYGGPLPDRVNRLYSNKLSVSDGSNLTLTYSGESLVGKEIYFETKDGKTATLTLLGVLPGEKETVVENVALTARSESYDFSGKGRGTNGTTFDFSGQVGDGSLACSLTNVKVAPNLLTAAGNWQLVYPASAENKLKDPETGKEYTLYHTGFRLYADDAGLSALRSTLNNILSNMLASVLREVTFRPDGNITARYAPLPEGTALTSILFSPLRRPDDAWTDSPLNLASYYVKEDVVYVVPQIDMIVRLIRTNRTKSLADAFGSLDWETVKTLYARLNKWTTTGIPLRIQTDLDRLELVQGKWERNEGDVCLYLNKAEIEPLIPLLPLVKELIPDEVMTGPAGSVLNNLLDPVIEGFAKSERLELGILFNH